ncbi:MAG: hypothetical protein KUG71_13970 [Porticoccaceae bacterium]|nr:hypothetical protein [Porticoccaceae bacterium]
MSNILTELLKTPTSERKAPDYEAVYDDFVICAGGERVEIRISVPEGTANNDYVFDLEDCEILLELKQVTGHGRYKSVQDYFLNTLNKKRVRKLISTHGHGAEIRIALESLSKHEWRKFYENYRPSVSTHLKKSAKQLRAINNLLPSSNKPRYKGVLLINSGDLSLATDLMYRLVEWKLKKEWRMGKFTSIDFACCTTIDMYKEGQHPLYARHIARSLEDLELVAAVKYIYESWIYYVADGIGSTVTKNKVVQPVNSSSIDLTTSFSGKIQMYD